MSFDTQDPYVWWRVLNAILAFTCLYILGRNFSKYGHKWTTRTKDFWYALSMWSFAAFAGSIEAILQHASGGSRLILFTVAPIVTLLGLMRKGPWGDEK